MADGVPALYRFDRFDERIGILPVLGDLVHSEELNGEDTIRFACGTVPAKGERLLWHDDADGCWREHVVVRTDEPLEGPCEVYAESSLCELLDDYVEEVHISEANSQDAATKLLGAAGSRWEVDKTNWAGVSGSIFYHMNLLAALRRLAEKWGVDMTAIVEVSGGKVTRRLLHFGYKTGTWRGARFTYGKSMVGCKRTVLEDEVYTALYGYGAGLPILDASGNPTGGYRRKLTFGSVNNGVNWVGDEDARLLWGRWNKDHTAKVHSFGQVDFPECDDATSLLWFTKFALAKMNTPRVSYELNVALVEGAAAVLLGDKVAVIDASRDPEWRLTARVLKRVRVFSDGIETRLTLGTVKPASYSATSLLKLKVASVEDAAGAAQDTATATTASVTTLTTKVTDLETAAGTSETGEVPTLATQTYVNDAIAALDDLNETEF